MEDRLKDAYAAATDTVSQENIRQLEEQSVLITWPGVKRPRPVSRWLVPLTSVAAVAIIAATALPAFLTSSGGGSATSSLGERFLGSFTGAGRVVIVNAATGAKVGSVAPPPHSSFSAAATGDGVTYVTVVYRQNACGARFYKFSLNSAGKPSRLTPFDGGQLVGNVTLLAMSADGHSFAYQAHACPFAATDPSVIHFVNFKTGQHRRWIVPGSEGTNVLSLSGDGGLLAVGGGPIRGHRLAILLVHTSGRSGSIDARSQVLVTSDEFGHHNRISVTTLAITPNGRTIFFETFGPGHGKIPSQQIRAIDVSTRRLRLVAHVTRLVAMAADPSVRRMIWIRSLLLPKPTPFMINLRTGHISGLPSSFFVPRGGFYLW